MLFAWLDERVMKDLQFYWSFQLQITCNNLTIVTLMMLLLCSQLLFLLVSLPVLILLGNFFFSFLASIIGKCSWFLPIIHRTFSIIWIIYLRALFLCLHKVKKINKFKKNKKRIVIFRISPQPNNFQFSNPCVSNHTFMFGSFLFFYFKFFFFVSLSTADFVINRKINAAKFKCHKKDWLGL